MLNTKSLMLLDFSKKDTSLQLFERSPLLTSHAARWNGIYLEEHYQLPYQTKPEKYALQHNIVISIATAPSLGGRILDGRTNRQPIVPGDVVIVPATVSHQTWSDTDRKFIILSLEPTQFSRAIYEANDPDSVELLPLFPKSDPLIYQIGLALKSELEAGGVGGCLYVETMANALAVHLLRHYTSKKFSVRNYSGGLSKAKLKQVIDYINEYLEQNLSLNELAAIVRMSPTYFANLFKQSTGLAPHQYLIQQRIKRAKRLLKTTDLKIIDIALECGFYNQSHFTKHFRILTQTTPNAYRKH